MLFVREVVRAIYNEIKNSFFYSIKEGEKVNKRFEGEKTKAKDLPFKSFLLKKGDTLEYSMAMIHRLNQNAIKAYLGSYVEQDPYEVDIKEVGYFVLYRESLFHYYIADFASQNPDDGIECPFRIQLRKYKKLKGELKFYNPYDKKNGNLPFFGEFLRKPKFKIR